jgi:hypothetical protein
MTGPQVSQHVFFSKRLQSGLVAILVALAIAFALRFTTLSAGLRVGTTFFIFAVLDSLLYKPLDSAPRTRAKLIGTFTIALVGALAMWWIATA